MGAETLAGTACDTECKWKRGINAVCFTAELEKLQIPTHEPYTKGDVRPTAEGYEILDRITEETVGLNLLETAARNCDAKACKIEDMINCTKSAHYGAKVMKLINDLKGE